MQATKTLTVVLALVCAFQAGLLLAPLLAGEALAETPETEQPGVPAAVAAATPRELLCRVFIVELKRDDVIETADRTSEIGQWLGDRADEGWVLSHLDFEIGQKPTGFPAGHVQVCVQPS